jgi:hypothetical protein
MRCVIQLLILFICMIMVYMMCYYFFLFNSQWWYNNNNNNNNMHRWLRFVKKKPTLTVNNFMRRTIYLLWLLYVLYSYSGIENRMHLLKIAEGYMPYVWFISDNVRQHGYLDRGLAPSASARLRIASTHIAVQRSPSHRLPEGRDQRMPVRPWVIIVDFYYINDGAVV